MKKTIKILVIGAGIAAFSIALNTMAAHLDKPIILASKSSYISEPDYKILIPKPLYRYPIGLTPKEYGMLYGNGKCRKYKTNKKHRSRLLRIRTSKF